MKILYCSLHPDLNLAAPSGPGTHMREVIRAFEEQGHTVVKWIAGGEALADHGAPIQFRKNTLRKLMPVWMWLTLKDLWLWRRNKQLVHTMREVISREKPDLIYERISYMSTAVAQAAHEAGVKHFVEFNAPYPEERRRLEGPSLTLFLAKKAERYQVRRCTKAFVISSVLKEYLIQVADVGEDKIVVTPNAVNPTKFKEDASAVEVLRRQLGWVNGERVVGFVGSIFPYHGVDMLIKAFERAFRAGGSDLRLLIVGDGETLPSLRSYVQVQQLEHIVHFTGNVPPAQVAACIALMDITVMARSDWYMSPVKIFEYGYMGKAILAQNTSPVRDVIVHGEHAWVVEADEESLSQGLNYLLMHPEHAARMAEAFRAKVHREHTWSRVGEAILKHYA